MTGICSQLYSFEIGNNLQCLLMAALIIALLIILVPKILSFWLEWKKLKNQNATEIQEKKEGLDREKTAYQNACSEMKNREWQIKQLKELVPLTEGNEKKEILTDIKNLILQKKVDFPSNIDEHVSHENEEEAEAGLGPFTWIAKLFQFLRRRKK